MDIILFKIPGLTQNHEEKYDDSKNHEKTKGQD